MSRAARREKLERRRAAMATDDQKSRRFVVIVGTFFVLAITVLLVKNWLDSGPVDLNKASVEKLETLPGIGPETAKAILKGRPYKNLEDLSRVKGIGPATIEKIREKAVAEE